MFKTAVVLAAVAATTSVSAYATYPQMCGSGEFVKFATILVSNYADLTECQQHAGDWKFIPPTRLPTVSEQTLMCANSGCDKLHAAIQKLSPADCFLSTNNSAVGINVKQFTDEYKPFCELL